MGSNPIFTTTNEIMIGSIKKFGFIKKKVILRDSDEEAYLIRYNLFECSLFSFKIHKILKSDELCLHDHPWKFISLILKGGYWEHIPPVNQHKEDITSTYNGTDYEKKWCGPLSLLVRPAHWIHRLEIPKGKYALTFVITFKKSKSWGFFTPKFGFVDFKEYNREDHCS